MVSLAVVYLKTHLLLLVRKPISCKFSVSMPFICQPPLYRRPTFWKYKNKLLWFSLKKQDQMPDTRHQQRFKFRSLRGTKNPSIRIINLKTVGCEIKCTFFLWEKLVSPSQIRIYLSVCCRTSKTESGSNEWMTVLLKSFNFERSSNEAGGVVNNLFFN